MPANRYGSIAAALAGIATLAFTACTSQSGDAQQTNPAPAAVAATAGDSVPACGPPDPEIEARKDRIAKGIYYAARRRAVDGDLERWDTVHGPFWVVAGNFRTFAEVLAEQAVEIYGDRTRGVQAGDIVIDGGAHFGGFTRTALERGAKLVVAVDIAPENIEVLRRNFSGPISAGRVVVVDQGLWDSQTTMTLERKNNTWADQASPQGAGPTITMTTIDRLVGDLGLETVDFIKLDIEGAERNALAGASSTMQKYRPRMAIAAYHEPDDVAVLSARVRTAQPAYDVCVNNGQLGHGYTTLMVR
jgi:FkbM family methyltransferase